MLKRITLTFIIFLIPELLYGAERFGMIFDADGNVQIQNPQGIIVQVKREKHILYTIKEGDKIEVGSNGKLLIVPFKEKKGYEITSNSLVMIKNNHLDILKGSVKEKEGFNIPNTVAEGTMGGIVIRDIEPCIKAIYPINTAVLDLEPELTWLSNCKNQGEFSIKIFADDRIIYTHRIKENTAKIPSGLLTHSRTYRWIVDGGSAYSISGGTFWIPEKTEIDKTTTFMEQYKQRKNILPERLSYLFFLLDNGLNSYANVEIEEILKEFPENDYIRELKTR